MLTIFASLVYIFIRCIIFQSSILFFFHALLKFIYNLIIIFLFILLTKLPALANSIDYSDISISELVDNSKSYNFDWYSFNKRYSLYLIARENQDYQHLGEASMSLFTSVKLDEINQLVLSSSWHQHHGRDGIFNIDAYHASQFIFDIMYRRELQPIVDIGLVPSIFVSFRNKYCEYSYENNQKLAEQLWRSANKDSELGRKNRILDNSQYESLLGISLVWQKVSFNLETGLTSTDYASLVDNKIEPIALAQLILPKILGYNIGMYYNWSPTFQAMGNSIERIIDADQNMSFIAWVENIQEDYQYDDTRYFIGFNYSFGFMPKTNLSLGVEASISNYSNNYLSSQLLDVNFFGQQQKKGLAQNKQSTQSSLRNKRVLQWWEKEEGDEGFLLFKILPRYKFVRDFVRNNPRETLLILIESFVIPGLIILECLDPYFHPIDPHPHLKRYTPTPDSLINY